jgi:hypothetical protein
LLFVAAVGATATSASAFRFEFLALSNGHRIPHADICFFSATSQGDIYSRLFSSADVRCLSADDVIDLPPGKWNFYARSGTALISDHPDLISYGGPDHADVGYKAVEVPLQPAAVIDVSDWVSTRRAGDSLFIYAASGPGRLATAFPVAVDTNKVVVPALTAMTPILFRSGRPFRVGETILLAEAEVRRAVLPSISPGFADVVIDTKLERTISGHVDRFDMPPPEFSLRTMSGETHEPLMPISNSVALVFSLVIFRNVPIGHALLTVSGPDWEPVQASLSVESPVTVAESVNLVVAGRLRIELAEPRHTASEVAVFHCEDMSRESGPCTLMARQMVAPSDRRDVVQFTSLPMGRYEIRMSGNEPSCSSVMVWPGREPTVVVK